MIGKSLLFVALTATWAAVACTTPSPQKGIDADCMLSASHAKLAYGVLRLELESDGVRPFQPLAAYLNQDGTLLSFADAMNVRNPDRNRATGGALVNEVSTNYLAYAGKPIGVLAHVNLQVRKETVWTPLERSKVYYSIARQLNRTRELVDTDPTSRYADSSGDLVSYDTALYVDNTAGDPGTGRAILKQRWGDYFREHGIRADVLYDLYLADVESCRKTGSPAE